MALNLTPEGLTLMTPDERAEALRYLQSSRLAKHTPHYEELVAALEAAAGSQPMTLTVGGRQLTISPGADGQTGTEDDVFSWAD